MYVCMLISNKVINVCNMYVLSDEIERAVTVRRGFQTKKTFFFAQLTGFFHTPNSC